LLWVTLIVAALTPSSCGSEPCEHGEELHPPSNTSPFPDGRTVFSVCGSCPVLKPGETGTDVSGPATVCLVSFSDERSEGVAICFYGPGGNTSTSAANSTVTGVPNEFDVCKTYCHGDYLHSCEFTADATGVIRLTCGYGKFCE
jgi:hypothetical protein